MKGYCVVGKKKYLKGQAIHIAHQRNVHNSRSGYAYECDKCQQWHVTKQSKQEYLQNRLDKLLGN